MEEVGIVVNWGNADFSELLQLQERLQGIQRDVERFCQSAARELAAQLLAKVIKRTPVGKKPHIAAKDENDKKALGGINATRTMKVKSINGKSRSFLTREGAILEQHWRGYVGGTLRRGWTAKTEEEAKSKTGATNGAEYAKSLPVYRNGGNYTIVVKNPVRYASYVEYGHRQTPGRYVPALGKQLKAAWVNGRYMLTISEQELRGQSQGILEKKLAVFLQEVFRGK